MGVVSFLRASRVAAKNANRITKVGTKTIVRDPQIMVYAYLAIGAIYLTAPLVSRFVYTAWNSLESPQVIAGVTQAAPSVLFERLGLVAFSIYWAVFVTSYFTCAASASVMAKLSGKPTTPLYGLRIVGKKFLRVTRFSLCAAFFFPLALIAQRKKLPRDIIGVLGGSYSLSMSQVAPAVLSSNAGVLQTIRLTNDTLGKAWHESLLIRLGIILATIGLGLLSFLPKLAQDYWINGRSAWIVGWIVALVLGLASYAVIRVLGTVFTTTLYFEASQKNLSSKARTLIDKAIAAW